MMPFELLVNDAIVVAMNDDIDLLVQVTRESTNSIENDIQAMLLQIGHKI
jgi:hypothetical protein